MRYRVIINWKRLFISLACMLTPIAIIGWIIPNEYTAIFTVISAIYGVVIGGLSVNYICHYEWYD